MRNFAFTIFLSSLCLSKRGNAIQNTYARDPSPANASGLSSQLYGATLNNQIPALSINQYVCSGEKLWLNQSINQASFGLQKKRCIQEKLRRVQCLVQNRRDLSVRIPISFTSADKKPLKSKYVYSATKLLRWYLEIFGGPKWWSSPLWSPPILDGPLSLQTCLHEACKKGNACVEFLKRIN